MGTTSQKLTYLNDTKLALKDMINNALDGNDKITSETTFRNYVRSLFDAFINSLTYPDVLFDNFPKVTGEGTGIVLNNTLESVMKLKLGTNMYQYSTTGKNLLKLDQFSGTFNTTSYTTMGEYLQIKNRYNNIGRTIDVDTNYFKSTRTNAYDNIQDWLLTNLSPNTTYTISCNVATTKQAGKITIFGRQINYNETSTYTTFTTDANGEFEFSVFYETEQVSGTYIELSNIQLEKGGTKTNFEPYTGGEASPNPDYPQDIYTVSGDNEIYVSNKNIFDLNETPNWVGGNTTYTIENEELNIAGNWFVGFPLAVEKNTDYYLSAVRKNASGSSAGNISIYNERNGQSIKNFGGSNGTFNSGDRNSVIILFYVGSGSAGAITYSNIQIEKGTSGTSYVSHKKQIYNLTLPVKNLLDFSTLQMGYVAYDGTISTAGITNEERYSNFIKVKPNTAYTFKIFESAWSGFNTNNWIGIGEYTSDNASSFIRRDTMTTTTQDYYTFTTSDTTEYVVLSARGLATATRVQFEIGSKVNYYTPYGQYLEYCKMGDYKDSIIKAIDKNLLQLPTTASSVYRATFTKLNDNSFLIERGDNAGSTGYIEINITNILKPNTTYTLSKKYSTTGYTFLNEGSIRLKINGTIESYQSSNSVTFTTPSSISSISVFFYLAGEDTQYSSQTGTITFDEIQLERRSTATDFEPYGLEKNKWYLRKNTGKVVLNGTEGFELWRTQGNYGLFVLSQANFTTNYIVSNIQKLLSNYFNCVGDGTLYNRQYQGVELNADSTRSLQISISNTKASTINDFNTWLSTHNTIVYYALKTPEYILLNDTLQVQLNNIEKAISYDDETNISQTNNDLPFIINASAIEELTE